MDYLPLILIFGIGAAVYAVAITFIGLRNNEFPSGKNALVGLIAVGAVLTLGTAIFANRFSIQEQHERAESEQPAVGEEETEASVEGVIRVPADLG